MAKKAVASMRKEGGKSVAKVIKAVKSPKTGAYTFREEMIPVDSVKEYLSKK